MISLLYVDDEPVLLEICKLYLESKGIFTVDTTESAQAALDKIHTTSYDAIISDYQMPGMDGIDFLKALRSSGDETPFIIFTGKGREEVVIKAFESGADFYLQKGGEPKAQFAELEHKVKQAVRLRKAGTVRRESEKKLISIIDFLPDATFAIDTNGRVIMWNHAIEKMTGVSADDMVGKGNFEYALLFYGERRPILIDLALQEYDKIRSEYTYIRCEDGRLVAETLGARLQGKEVVLWGMASPLYDSYGQLTGAIESIRDITAYRRAEEAFHESYALLNGIVESPRNVVIFALDREYRYLAFNDNHRRTMKQIWGVDIVIGVSMLAYISVASDRERAKENFDRALSGESFTITEEYGDVLHERRWYEDTYNPIRDKDGTIIGLTLFLTDVTGCNQTEQALRESEERFRLIAENTTDTIWMMRTDGTFTYHSPAVEHLRGYTPAEADRLTLNETFTPASLEYIMEIFREEGRKPAAEQWPDRTVELEMFHKDGTTVWTEVSIRAVRDAKGNVTHLQGSTRDITVRKRGEEAIRQSEEKFRNLLENMPDLVLVHRDGKFLYVNPAMIKTLGFTPEDVQNKPIVDYIVPKYHKRVAASIQKRNAAQPQEPYEIEIRSKRGELRTVIVRGALIEFGGSPAILNVLTDVTERRRADRDLRESESRYSALFDRNYSISLLIDPDTARIVDANDAACHYYGFSRDQLMARGIYDLNRLPREKVISHLIRAKNEREKHFFSTHYLADGERRNVEIYSGPITVQGRPLFYSIIHDITDRKQMEQSLRESEQRYHNIIEDQTEFICRFTPDGTHVFINDAYARYFGKTREELIGRIFHPDIFPDDREKVRQFFATLTPEHPVDYIQHRIIMPDGEVRWQRWSDRAIFDDGGSVVEYQSVGRDVSAQKRVEEALHIANTKLSLLFSITRHDIFNQLTVLDGYLDMLHEEIPDRSKSDYFTRIANASAMIESIIRFTEAYEQIGVHLPVWQDIGIQVTATGRTIDTGRINLVNHIPAGTEVNADPMIMKVFFNLLDNSIRHGQRVTMIRVSCRESDVGLTILWEDDGVGIPDKEKSLIFKRGYGKNTGLGLFLVQEILSINEITIKETGEPEKGARFEIAVPKGRYRFTEAGEK